MQTDNTEPTNFPDGEPENRQPKWRRDFPIDIEADEYGARRDFTKFMVLTSLSFVVGQFWIALQSWFRRADKLPRQRIAAADELSDGGVRSFSYPSERDPCLLIRASENRYYAYSSECTHLMCPVRPELDCNRLRCPCHEGYFEVETGHPTAGPPRRPLAKIVLEIDDGTIYATGVEVRPS